MLKFTYEIENKRTIPFLDVLVRRLVQNTVTMSVYVKKTHSGDVINYHSIAPDRYKTGVIKTMLQRAHTVCSTWAGFDAEVTRLKQLFTNNNYPMQVINTIVNSFMSKITSTDTPQPPPSEIPPVQFFYRNQMSSQYKQEERNLQRIINRCVVPRNDARMQLHIYYKNKKLRSLFIKNNPHASKDHHVVYKYTCAITSLCQQDKYYIGYTTTTLKQRMTMHAQKGSILEHATETHDYRIRTAEILENITNLFHSPDKQELEIAEALLIKEKKPTLNNQREGECRILKIF